MHNFSLALGTIIAITAMIAIPTTRLLSTSNPVYGQPDQINPNVTNSLNVQNITAKKVHVGDIDIAYKVFGKGDPILLISGASVKN